jgi:hypothetical protein
MLLTASLVPLCLPLGRPARRTFIRISFLTSPTGSMATPSPSSSLASSITATTRVPPKRMTASSPSRSTLASLSTSLSTSMGALLSLFSRFSLFSFRFSLLFSFSLSLLFRSSLSLLFHSFFSFSLLFFSFCLLSSLIGNLYSNPFLTASTSARPPASTTRLRLRTMPTSAIPSTSSAT